MVLDGGFGSSRASGGVFLCFEVTSGGLLRWASVQGEGGATPGDSDCASQPDSGAAWRQWASMETGAAMGKSVSGLALDLRNESAFVKIWGKRSFDHCFHAREGNRHWGGGLA
jgi:hypothetical protein